MLQTWFSKKWHCWSHFWNFLQLWHVWNACFRHGLDWSVSHAIRPDWDHLLTGHSSNLEELQTRYSQNWPFWHFYGSFWHFLHFLKLQDVLNGHLRHGMTLSGPSLVRIIASHIQTTHSDDLKYFSKIGSKKVQKCHFRHLKCHFWHFPSWINLNQNLVWVHFCEVYKDPQKKIGKSNLPNTRGI